MLTCSQDREAEPRFGPPGGASRGGFAGGAMGGGPYGGYNPNMAGGGAPGGGGRQIYISNVGHILPIRHATVNWIVLVLTDDK